MTELNMDWTAFEVKQNAKGNISFLINHSNYYLYVSVIPIPPKRKYYDILRVNPNTIIVIEQELMITNLSFRLERQ
jgi:hypothetical protein